MGTHYYTASSLDGFIATTQHSLDWLLKQEIDQDGPMAYPAFEKNVGALAMGASTFEWVMRHEDGRWGYTQPTWVFTHREIEIPSGLTFVAQRETLRRCTARWSTPPGERISGWSVVAISRVSSPMPGFSTRSGCSTRPSLSEPERRFCREPSTSNSSRWLATATSCAAATEWPGA